MSPTDIEEILEMTPFKPLRFTLSSGDKFVVTKRFRAMVAEGGGVVYLSLKERDPDTGQHLRMISAVNIAMVERLESAPPPENGARRRRR